MTAAVLDADGRLVPRPAAAPRGPDGALGGISATSTGTVALANVADPDDDADGGAGRRRRVVAAGSGRHVVADPRSSSVGPVARR